MDVSYLHMNHKWFQFFVVKIIDDNDSPDEIPLCKHKYIYTYLLSFK